MLPGAEHEIPVERQEARGRLAQHGHVERPRAVDRRVVAVGDVPREDAVRPRERAQCAYPRLVLHDQRVAELALVPRVRHEERVAVRLPEIALHRSAAALVQVHEEQLHGAYRARAAALRVEVPELGDREAVRLRRRPRGGHPPRPHRQGPGGAPHGGIRRLRPPLLRTLGCPRDVNILIWTPRSR